MTELEKLYIAQQQIQYLITLLENNSYETYINLKLTSVYYELKRQISLHH